jgi:hypothetical protein
MNKFFKDESGIAIIMVIILLLAVGTLVSALMSAEVFNISFTENDVNQTKAFYLAEAGVQRVESLFNKHGNSIFDDQDNDFLYNEKELSFDGQPGFYKVTKDPIIEDDKAKIEILGKYKNSEKRLGITIDLSSDFSLSNVVENSLFAAGTNILGSSVINLKGSSSITGDVKSNISDYDLIQLDGSSYIDGNLSLNYQESPPENIKQEKKPGDTEWTLDNSPYDSGDGIIWHDGLYYRARYYTASHEPGTHEVWQVVIPEGENWPWFEKQIYNSGDKVWHKKENEDNKELYTAKYSTQGSEPTDLVAWERQIPNVSKNIEYTEKVDYPDVNFPQFPKFEQDIPKTIETKGNKNGILDEDGYYDQITVKSNTNLTIDRNDSDRIIRVKNLNIDQGHVKFADPNGKGKLIIYVEESINFGGSSTFGNLEQKENVIIHYAGSDSIDFKGSTKFYGSLNVESADINLGGSNAVSGYIFSGGENITVSGAVSIPGQNNNEDDGVLIYALNSNLSFNGSGSLKGSAIVNNVNLVGNTSIDYARPNFEDYFFIEDILDFENSSGGSNSSGGDNNIIWYNK